MKQLRSLSAQTWWGIGILAPIVLLTSRRARKSPGLLFAASSLVITGIVLNRIDVFLVAYRPHFMTTAYVPSAAEVLVSVGLTAGLVFAYRVAVTVFPVFACEKAQDNLIVMKPHEAVTSVEGLEVANAK